MDIKCRKYLILRGTLLVRDTFSKAIITPLIKYKYLTFTQGLKVLKVLRVKYILHLDF